MNVCRLGHKQNGQTEASLVIIIFQIRPNPLIKPLAEQPLRLVSLADHRNGVY